MNKDVLFDRMGKIGCISLNRNHALNALSIDMMCQISAQLQQWKSDPDIECIVLKHSGGKAFCAGGDIREIYSMDHSASLQDRTRLLRIEYTLDDQIAHYPKPILAIIDGITFGGGAGISLNASHVLATEKTVFAMPEARIGIVPDAGIDRLLVALDRQIGLYIAMTGTHIHPQDMLNFGLIQHCVVSKAIPNLLQKLALERKITNASLSQFLNNHEQPNLEPSQFSTEIYDWIAQIFSIATTEQLLQRVLVDSQNPALTDSIVCFAKTVQKQLNMASPLSLCLVQEYMRHPKPNLAHTLQQNYIIVQNCLDFGDFYEGVRALIIDKDQQPIWRYPTASDINHTVLRQFFTPQLPALIFN